MARRRIPPVRSLQPQPCPDARARRALRHRNRDAHGGDTLSLTWRNVDMAQRIATLPDTKTGDARQVPLSTAAVAAVSSLPRHISDGRVFWTWQRADSLENAWRRAVKRAGIEDLRFHDLRHEAVSRLFELGLNPMEVASISGHKTLQMLKRYTHLRASELVKKLA